jgi:hypothetical protein
MPSDAEAEAMIEVILPDGAKRQLVSGSTGAALATDISKSLAKKAIAIKQNGKLVDLALELTDGAAVEVITIDSPEALELLRHDCPAACLGSIARAAAASISICWIRSSIAANLRSGRKKAFNRTISRLS